MLAASIVVPGIAPATHTRLTRASVDNDGGYSGWSIEHSSLSGDGRRVAFDVYGSLLPEDRNYNYHDVYVRDLDAEMTTLVSVAPDGGPAYGNHTSPVISGNGRFVAFVSDSPDLVAGDTNGVADVFVRDLEAGTTQRVSLGDDGQEASDASETASISDDGRAIAFVSHASNLVSGDDNNAGDVFVRDVGAGTTTIESVSTDGDIADAGVSEAAISGDGDTVAFVTQSTNLAPGDSSTCGMRLPPH